MRILIAVHKLTGGGAERVAACWSDSLARLGHEVILLTDVETPHHYPIHSSVKIINRKYIRINDSNRSLPRQIVATLVNGPKAFLQYRSLMNRFRPDAVICVLHLNPYALRLAKSTVAINPVLVASDHNPYERPEGMKMGWKVWKHKFIDNRIFDLVTVLTRRDKDILAQHSIDKVEAIPNPLFSGIPDEKLRNGARSKTVLSVGRIGASYVKGFDILISEWKEIRKQHSDWILRVVGEGTSEEISRLKDFGGDELDGIQILPFESDISRHYLDAEIFVMSSRYEGWGLALTEAMAHGCAVVAADFRGRQREIVTDGHDGIIVSPGNGNELRDAIIRLIEDDGLRSSFQRNAPKGVERFDKEIVGRMLAEVLEGNINRIAEKGGRKC